MLHHLINSVYNRGVYAVNAVAVERVLEVMSALHPQSTNHEMVRIGGDGDGGYLVPDDLEGITRCFSPGVSDIATFEEEVAQRGIRSFLADYSVEQPPVANEAFHFEKKYLGSFNDDVFTTLADWVDRHAPPEGRDMILQIDIEGWEYETLMAAPSALLDRFRIIVAEFHYLRDMMTPFGNQVIGSTFKKLTKNHAVVHSHPNNCFPAFHYKDAVFPAALEVTFLRKDRITSAQPTEHFPHYLDMACVPNRPDIILPKCWRGG